MTQCKCDKCNDTGKILVRTGDEVDWDWCECEIAKLGDGKGGWDRDGKV